LLIKLEEEKYLGIDSLDVLKDLLARMGNWNLRRAVEKFENKRKEYKSLLKQCGRVLDDCSQLERLIAVCEGKISHDRQEHITDVWTLFTELEKQNNLGITRLEILKAMATEMKKPDLLQKVEEFEKKREQEEDAERQKNELEEARRRSKVRTAAVLASASYAGGRLIGIVTPHCTFRNVAGGIVVVTTWMILRRSSNLQEFVKTFTEAVLPLGNTLRAISQGSLCFSVQAQTTSALEALWKEYQDGTLQRNLQEFLITEEIKQLVGSEVKLTVKIDEKEHDNAVRDLITAETQEMEVKEEMKGFEDQSSSDSAHATVKKAHPEVREEDSQNTDSNLPDRIAFVEEYMANLRESGSMTTETTDSGLWSQSAPSEWALYKGAGDIQELLEQVDKWMKDISKKLDILTESRESGGSTDEDILDNIQQVRKEMENIRQALETLGKPEGKTKYGGSGLIKRPWRAVTRERKPIDTFLKTPPQLHADSAPLPGSVQ